LEKSSLAIHKAKEYWESNSILNTMNMPVKKMYAQFLASVLNQKKEGDKIYLSYIQNIKKHGQMTTPNIERDFSLKLNGGKGNGQQAENNDVEEEIGENEFSFIDQDDLP
jgi:hypothetical protein